MCCSSSFFTSAAVLGEGKSNTTLDPDDLIGQKLTELQIWETGGGLLGHFESAASTTPLPGMLMETFPTFQLKKSGCFMFRFEL